MMQPINKKIYKKDSKGKIRVLTILTEKDELVQKSSLLGGKEVEHRKVCTSKNVGKANETTGEEQAISQAESLIKKKLREGYFETQSEAESTVVVKPMLAKDYFKESHKLKDKSLACQPKLDGIRCVLKYDVLTAKASAKTRENVPIETIEHVLEAVEEQLKNYLGNDIIFDGELYLHGRTFQECTKLVKNKYNPEDYIKYHIYDIVDLTGKKTFEERSNTINSLLINDEVIEVVPTYKNCTDLEEFYKKCVSKGYEGIMVRILDSKYKVNGRSSDLLKYKKFEDIALPIVDITPSDARPTHGVVWIEYNGIKQKTGSKIPHSEREYMLSNKSEFIGKTAEIRYFEETDEGKLRFAYYHGVRVDR